MPDRCNEQRLNKFIPTIAALHYLNATNQLTSKIRMDGENFLRKGYQQIQYNQLTEGSKEGAFTIWGKAKDFWVNSEGNIIKTYNRNTVDLNASDSIWMTAYVVKCLGKAKHLITIDDKHLRKALSFLKRMQTEEGSFPEYSKVSTQYLYSDLSASWEGVSLTAFTVIAFLESKGYENDFAVTITKALNYINVNVGNLKSNYALAIASYALALGGQKQTANYILIILLTNALVVDDRVMYWNNELANASIKTPLSTKVEIAAYVVLTYVKLGRAKEAHLIVKWLVSQQSSKGGFSSTQDTSIALQALSEYATELYSKDVNMDIKMSFDIEHQINFKVNETNRLGKQFKRIPSNVRTVSINANGTGIASLQVTRNYKKVHNESEGFSLWLSLASSSNNAVVILNINAKRDHKEFSALTMIEITLPSGFEYDTTVDLVGSYGIRVSHKFA